MNFIILRESKQTVATRIMTFAKEIQKIHPVGAFILFCKNFIHQDGGYYSYDHTLETILLNLVIEFNQKSVIERNSTSVPPLRSICASVASKELINGSDWTQLTQVYLALAEDLQKEVALALYVEGVCKGNRYYQAAYKRLKKEGEIRSAFQIGCHFIFELCQEYGYFDFPIEICSMSFEFGQYAVKTLFESIKEKVSKVQLIYKFAKILEDNNYQEYSFSLALQCLENIKEAEDPASIDISRWICESSINNEEKIKKIVGTLRINPNIKLIYSVVGILTQKKEYHDLCVPLLIEGYQRNDFCLYDANEKRIKKYNLHCDCKDCKKIEKELENYEKEFKCTLQTDSSHVDKKLSLCIFPEFIYQINNYSGPPSLTVRRKNTNYNGNDMLPLKVLCSVTIPQFLLNLYQKKDSTNKMDHILELEKHFLDSASLCTLAEAALPIDEKEAMRIALKSAKAPGNFERSRIRDIFGEKGDYNFKFSLSDSIMRKEPKASNFHKLKELDKNIKLDSYLDISTIKDQTIPILLMEGKFKEITEAFKSPSIEKHKYISTLLRECTDQKISADLVVKHFLPMVEEYFSSQFLLYSIELFYHFPRTSTDEIIQVVLSSNTKDYQTILGVKLVTIRTLSFMSKITSTKSGSYRKFAEWLQFCKQYFPKEGIEWKNFLEMIYSNPIVRSKKKLVSSIQNALI
jgi:hypothetical protein